MTTVKPSGMLRRRGFLLHAGAFLAWNASVVAKSPTDDLTPIGGAWFVGAGKPKTYYYLDGRDLVDPFSSHCEDFNKDGIPNLSVSHEGQHLVLDSQGLPDHPTGTFPNSGNPNTIRPQNFRFVLPLVPKKAESITTLPMGPIGTAVNGVVFFNPFEAGGMNAVEGYSEVWLDSCCGHPQQHGVYHYHKYPSCVKTPFRDEGKRHSPILGFAWDGYPLHGPYESNGRMAMECKDEQALDVCNGHSDPVRGYHYHVTPGRFPYIIGGYAGVPAQSNIHGPRSKSKTGAIKDNASGTSTIGVEISSVRPGTIVKGKTHTLRFELNSARRSRRSMPQSAPKNVHIGPMEGKNIVRNGDVVTADFAVPEDLPSGALMDCHLEFASPRRADFLLAFKKNDVVRIVGRDDGK